MMANKESFKQHIHRKTAMGLGPRLKGRRLCPGVGFERDKEQNDIGGFRLRKLLK